MRKVFDARKMAEGVFAKWGCSGFQKLPGNVSIGAVFKGIEFRRAPPKTRAIRI
jgi:hypothetical protein